MKNNVLVIGANHHNTLGVIRMLGINGIFSNVIIINDNKYSYVTKSKFVNKAIIINEDEQKLLEEILKFSNINSNILLIPTSDFAASVIDKNFNLLSKNFILPSIMNKEGYIDYYMDKNIQTELYDKFNIPHAKSKIISLKNIEPQNIKYPIIIKPYKSVLGQKNDICVAKDANEMSEYKNNLINLKYEKVLMQEFLNYDQEYTLMGISYEGNVICPGAVKKIRRYPKSTGSVSYGIIIPYEDINLDLQPIFNLLNKIKYNGLFDIEIFKCDNSYYINEINFRNSGNTFALMYGNVNLIWVYYNLVMKTNIKSNTRLDKEYFICDEFLEKKQLKDNNISLKEYFKSKEKSKSFFVSKCKYDRMIIFWKNLYAILRRIDPNAKFKK